MIESRWRLTPPGVWLALKLAAIPPIVVFIGQFVAFISHRDQEVLIAMLMGIIVCDALITRWAYARRSRTA